MSQDSENFSLLLKSRKSKIEVLSGSEGSLYGSDAMAGVISIITKKEWNKRVYLDLEQDKLQSGFSYGGSVNNKNITLFLKSLKKNSTQSSLTLFLFLLSPQVRR